MSTQRSVIEKKAYGIAAANFLSFDDSAFDADPYLAYLEYESAVDDKREPHGLEVWGPLESYDDVLEEIDDLARHVLREMKDALRLAKEGIVNEAIECRLDSDMNTLDMPGLVDIGSALERDQQPGVTVEAKEPVEEEDLDVVLRRHDVSVTRVAYSSEKQFSVLATSREEAEAKALELAYDVEFSCGDAEYECKVNDAQSGPLPSGAVITWCDPSTGEKQDVIYRKSHGEIVFCHTFGGGELEAFSAELH